MMFEKRPRQYAHEITKMKTADERKAALAKVPEHLRELVKTHVEITWSFSRYWTMKKARQ